MRLSTTDGGRGAFLTLATLVVVCIRTTVVNGGNPDAKRLYDDLLSDYNKLVRPVVNVSEAVTVRLKLKLSQLIDVVRINNKLIKLKLQKIRTATVRNPTW